MRNWAIIVGINRYPSDAGQNPLHGAVADAADFADWALHPLGGDVDPARCFLWTSPKPAQMTNKVAQRVRTPTPWTRGVVDPATGRPKPVIPDFREPPTVQEIFQTAYQAALDALSLNSDDDEENRCFVFFAGHGVRARVMGNDRDYQTCFLAGDYQGSGAITGLLPTEDLRLGLLATGFNEVFLFLDCCRLQAQRYNSLVLPLNFPIAQVPPERLWSVGYAAENDRAAWETPCDAPTRGAYTKLLTEGLRHVRDEQGELNLQALEDYIANLIGPTVLPNTQSPWFNTDRRKQRVIVARGAPIALPENSATEEIEVAFGAITPGTDIYLRNGAGDTIDTLTAGAAPQRARAGVGQLYTLESDDGSIEHGFVHGGPGVTYVQL